MASKEKNFEKIEVIKLRPVIISKIPAAYMSWDSGTPKRPAIVIKPGDVQVASQYDK